MDKDWLKKNGRKVMDAYSIAVANKIDLSSVKDVVKILRVVDPENANESYAKEFSKMLQLFEKTIQKKIKQPIKSQKAKVVN